MKHVARIFALPLMIAALGASGCAAPWVGGALVGGTGGALVGSATGIGTTTGAIIGGTAGAVIADDKADKKGRYERNPD